MFGLQFLRPWIIKRQNQIASINAWNKIKFALRLDVFAHHIFAHEALAHRDLIMCIVTARRPVYNEPFHCCND